MKLPVVSGTEVVAALRKLGYEEDLQHGSHVILRHLDPPHRRLSVPNHRELAKGTLRALIREAGLTVDEFARLSIEVPRQDRFLPRAMLASSMAYPSGPRPAGGMAAERRAHA